METAGCDSVLGMGSKIMPKDYVIVPGHTFRVPTTFEASGETSTLLYPEIVTYDEKKSKIRYMVRVKKTGAKRALEATE